MPNAPKNAAERQADALERIATAMERLLADRGSSLWDGLGPHARVTLAYVNTATTLRGAPPEAIVHAEKTLKHMLSVCQLRHDP